jgi:serine/threonine protein kinase
LRPIAINDFEEEELNALILSVTGEALSTTREARLRLARTAGNIYILRTLVDGLAEHVQRDGREWASYDDVFAVENDLRTSLREGNEQVVSYYIRDILNDAEDVSYWKPNPALPLAIALAFARREGRAPISKLYEAARLILNEWYDSIAPDKTTRFEDDDQQFKEHLRTLEERRILQNREFLSCLLEDWLLGFPKRVAHQEWKELLRTAAIKRIKLPTSMQKVEDAEGGEATVWTANRDDVKYAFRITRLKTDEDKSRFSRVREVLESLRDRVRDGSAVAGSQYVFKLEDMGLSADDELQAVQVYRWVEGMPLSHRLHQLPSSYVVDLGIKLASAIHFLHSFNVVHRDLSPRNVVLAEDGGDPIIIDFGFARRLTPDANSIRESEYSAPEVQRPNPKWTKSADIFSLGSTLEAVLDAKEPCMALRNILQRCQIDDPEKRPEAADLARMFKQVADDLHLDNLKRRVLEEVLDKCKTDYKNFPWFRGLVDKFEGNFKGVALGCFIHQFDRCREAANFLNQVLEAWPGERSDHLSLGKVKDENQTTGKTLATKAVRFMHAIRRHHSHGEYVKKERTTSKFRNPNDVEMRAMALEATQQIADHVKISSLTAILEHLL